MGVRDIDSVDCDTCEIFNWSPTRCPDCWKKKICEEIDTLFP